MRGRCVSRRFDKATDGAANSDADRAWPGDYAKGATSLAKYCSKLVQNDYLKAEDLQKILNAPGVSCTVIKHSRPSVHSDSYWHDECAQSLQCEPRRFFKCDFRRECKLHLRHASLCEGRAFRRKALATMH